MLTHRGLLPNTAYRTESSLEERRCEVYPSRSGGHPGAVAWPVGGADHPRCRSRRPANRERPEKPATEPSAPGRRRFAGDHDVEFFRNITIGDDLTCAVNHVDDTHGEFYGDTACATLVAVNSVLFGPAFIPAGDSASPRTTFSPVSQSSVTGSGTIVDP